MLHTHEVTGSSPVVSTRYYIEDLCNGSTPDSDSVCGGSNPSSSAKSTCLQRVLFRYPFLRQRRTIASASLRRLFAPLLQFEKREIHTGFQSDKKASQSLPPAGGKGILIIFCRGVYLTENTTQAASVRFVRQGRTNRARGRLQSFCQKRAKPFFDSLSGHPSGARSVRKTSLAEFAALS